MLMRKFCTWHLGSHTTSTQESELHSFKLFSGLLEACFSSYPNYNNRRVLI